MAVQANNMQLFHKKILCLTNIRGLILELGRNFPIGIRPVNLKNIKLFACWVILMLLLSSADILQNYFFQKRISETLIRIPNGLNPDQNR